MDKNQKSKEKQEKEEKINNASRNVLYVDVRDPDKLIFSGQANAISSKNSMGPFDILPQHENFISLLTDKITIYLDRHQKREIENTNAIVKAKLNKVNIFLGISSLISASNLSSQPKKLNPKLKSDA